MKAKLAAWRKVALETIKNWFGHGSMAESAALAERPPEAGAKRQPAEKTAQRKTEPRTPR
jgi:hypothetical protein